MKRAVRARPTMNEVLVERPDARRQRLLAHAHLVEAIGDDGAEERVGEFGERMRGHGRAPCARSGGQRLTGVMAMASDPMIGLDRLEPWRLLFAPRHRIG